MASIVRDVNREEYLKALFIDLKKQAGIRELPEKSKVIYNFIMSNNSGTMMSKNGIEMTKDGLYIIKSRKKK